MREHHHLARRSYPINTRTARVSVSYQTIPSLFHASSCARASLTNLIPGSQNDGFPSHARAHVQPTREIRTKDKGRYVHIHRPPRPSLPTDP